MRHHTDEEYRRARRNLFLILIALAALMWLTSCKQTEIVTVEKVRTDTTYITKFEHDSIHVHDSIRVSERGDSVIIDRWHTKYVESIRIDTLYQSKTDSIPVPYPVKEYVEKPLAWYERGLMFIGGSMLILLTAVAIIWRFRKKLIIE